MPQIDIVLVEPLYEGNIGFASRVMNNFGFHRMVLINSPKMTIEVSARASHAKEVLESAEILTLDEVFVRSDLTIGDHRRSGKVGVKSDADAVLLSGRAAGDDQRGERAGVHSLRPGKLGAEQ